MSKDAVPTLKFNRKAAIAVLAFLAIAVRLVALHSDAYPSLSWSSALLTDEGFYIHNARNAVLFGNARQDGFNNMLIMPVLHGIQVAVFRVIGVGTVQARLIPVCLSLMGLLFFYCAANMLYGWRTAFIATLFLGLDHARFLYDRLALMDSPAASMLCLALWLLVKGCLKRNNSRFWFLAMAGAVTVASYGIRGLTAPLMLLPLFLITPGALRQGFKELWPAIACALGSILAASIYLVTWYLPNRVEMKHSNAYYAQQLLPAGKAELTRNLFVALLGEGRGLVPFMLHHSPVVFLLARAWFALGRGELKSRRSTGAISTQLNHESMHRAADTAVTVFNAWWLGSVALILIIANYSPSRYYVLMSPPLALFAARMAAHIPQLPRALLQRPLVTAIISGLVCYHLAVALLDRTQPTLPEHFALAYPPAVGAALISAACALYFRRDSALPAHIARRFGLLHPRRIQAVTVIVWAAINLAWCADWLTHITYRQASADATIGRITERDAVIFGALAPGLCIDNGRRVVLMISGLCNDIDPINSLAANNGKPAYVAVLDENGWKEEWWFHHYPYELGPDNKMQSYRHMLRPNFNVGLYRVTKKPYWRQD